MTVSSIIHDYYNIAVVECCLGERFWWKLINIVHVTAVARHWVAAAAVCCKCFNPSKLFVKNVNGVCDVLYCQVWRNSLIVSTAAVVYCIWRAVCRCWVHTWLKAYDVCSEAQQSDTSWDDDDAATFKCMCGCDIDELTVCANIMVIATIGLPWSTSHHCTSQLALLCCHCHYDVSIISCDASVSLSWVVSLVVWIVELYSMYQ